LNPTHLDLRNEDFCEFEGDAKKNIDKKKTTKVELNYWSFSQ